MTLGGKLVREVRGTTATIDYLYDNNGMPYQITVREGASTYTGDFVLNQQGDVIALVNGSGSALVTYSYDAWGRQLSCTTSGTNGAKLYTYNRLKYRGYYYDSDLGMNLYAYCENNPVMLCDSTGTRTIASTRTDNETPEERSTSLDWMNASKPIDITNKLDTAMEEDAKKVSVIYKTFGFAVASVYFADKVKPGGEWDFKAQSDWGLREDQKYYYRGKILRFDDPGNIHYGYVGRILYPKQVLLIAGGIVQICTDTSSQEYSSSWFDDPRDQEMISYGYSLWDLN